MSRLIDADILIAELKESAFHHCNNPREDSLLQRDRVIVRAQPTVKAIPIEKFEQIRAEIESKYGQCDICEYFEDYDYEENDISEYRPIGDIADILQIIDKYKADE